MTVVVLTTTGANSWTVPQDWNSSANSIECIGAGRTGIAGTDAPSGTRGGGGGNGQGGGAYAKITNLSLTPNGSVNYNIAVSGDATGTWFYSNTTVLAANASGISGGTTAASIGTTKYAGGNGGAGGCHYRLSNAPLEKRLPGNRYAGFWRDSPNRVQQLGLCQRA